MGDPQKTILGASSTLWRAVLARDVVGHPKGQPRPRAFARGGKARVYDPGTAEGWKSTVAMTCPPPAVMLDGPVAVTMSFRMPRPKRLKVDREVPHTARPDSDNLAKAVLDALTAVGWWRDDSQVSTLTVGKRYCHSGEAAGMHLAIYTREP